ncbi:hypothetical protein [Niallia circulans]|uniref:ParM/StbA family protein n=1 Tax=Niallia circulans TaxID=1397 RepID=UPI001F48DC87|nr:hypothetical protein [Niallia circulans]MCF2649683.1 hypothetical protein [Niallia circulans]
MKEKILIAVDCGKYQTKGIARYKGNTYMTTFRTKMQQVKRLGVDIQPNSYLVEFYGNEYLLGDMVSEDYSDFSLNKASRIHHLSIYTAIARLLQKANAPSNVDIHLAVNTPITTYKDSIQKENFKQLVENQGHTVHLMVNNKAFSFDLSKVTIAFEGMGEIFEESKVFIEEIKFEHLQQIVQFAKSRGYTFNMTDIHFVGGGSIILRRYIKQEFPHAVIMENPQYSNCLYFLKILEVKYA